MRERDITRAQQSSSQAPPLPLEVVPEPIPDGNHRPQRACSQPEDKNGSGRESRSGLNFGLLNTHHVTFPKIWEIPKLTLRREAQKLGTLEHILTRLKIFFRSALGDLSSTS